MLGASGSHTLALSYGVLNTVSQPMILSGCSWMPELRGLFSRTGHDGVMFCAPASATGGATQKSKTYTSCYYYRMRQRNRKPRPRGPSLVPQEEAFRSFLELGKVPAKIVVPKIRVSPKPEIKPRKRTHSTLKGRYLRTQSWLRSRMQKVQNRTQELRELLRSSANYRYVKSTTNECSFKCPHQFSSRDACKRCEYNRTDYCKFLSFKPCGVCVQQKFIYGNDGLKTKGFKCDGPCGIFTYQQYTRFARPFIRFDDRIFTYRIKIGRNLVLPDRELNLSLDAASQRIHSFLEM